jgi:hypothetical protein
MKREDQARFTSSDNPIDHPVGWVNKQTWSSERWHDCFDDIVGEFDNWIRTHEAGVGRRFKDACFKCCLYNKWAMTIRISLRIDYTVGSQIDTDCVKHEAIAFMHNATTQRDTYRRINIVFLAGKGSSVASLDSCISVKSSFFCDNPAA